MNTKSYAEISEEDKREYEWTEVTIPIDSERQFVRGNKKNTEPIYCPHISKENTIGVYRAMTLAGDFKLWLCRACWGEFVVAVHDWATDIRVKVK